MSEHTPGPWKVQMLRTKRTPTLAELMNLAKRKGRELTAHDDLLMLWKFPEARPRIEVRGDLAKEMAFAALSALPDAPKKGTR